MQGKTDKFNTKQKYCKGDNRPDDRARGSQDEREGDDDQSPTNHLKKRGRTGGRRSKNLQANNANANECKDSHITRNEYETGGERWGNGKELIPTHMMTIR